MRIICVLLSHFIPLSDYQFKHKILSIIFLRRGKKMSCYFYILCKYWKKHLHTALSLLFSGLLISALGATMDVAMSISSACWELRELNPDLPRKALFRSGMNIGQDAMGTMANTLILAFAGSSLNTLLLFQIFDYPMIQIFNADSIAIEIIRGVAGTIGIILTVPLVALLSAEIMGPKKNA